MNRRALNPVWGIAALKAFLDLGNDAVGAPGPLDGGVLRLFVNAFDPASDMVPADFTEATFAGYASVTPLAWSVAVNAGDAGVVIIVQSLFIGGAIVAPGETVEGYYLENAGGTAVILAERFADPVPFANLGDFLELDNMIELPFIGNVTV